MPSHSEGIGTDWGAVPFTTTDRKVLAQHWHPVAGSAELVDRPLGVRLLDEDLVLYRTSTGVVAAKDLCIHRGTPLTLGWMDGDEIVCGYHGFRYGHDGRCTLVPAHPDRPIPSKLRLETYLTKERYGLIWVCLAGTPRTPLPEWGEAEDPTYRLLHLEPLDWRASAARQIENFLDLAHLSWVHMDTFGNTNSPEVADYEVQENEDGLRFSYDYLAGNPQSSPLADQEVIRRQMTYDLTLPFSIRLTINYPEGRKHLIFNAASPVAANRVRIFFSIARNFDHDKPAEELLDWERSILLQDARIVQAQRPEELPLDIAAELHIKADRASISYRRALAMLGMGRPHTS